MSRYVVQDRCVRIPALVELVVTDKAHAGLDEASGEQQRLAKLVASVSIAHGGRFAIQIERLAHAPVDD